MNLKKLAKRKWKERYPSYLICFELLISNYLRKNPSFAQAKLGFLNSLRGATSAPLLKYRVRIKLFYSAHKSHEHSSSLSSGSRTLWLNGGICYTGD